MIRAVLDTNILVSALLPPKGLPAQTFLMAIAGTAVQLCVSGEIYAEYEEVIRRPRFKRSLSEIDSVLETVREKGLSLVIKGENISCLGGTKCLAGTLAFSNKRMEVHRPQPGDHPKTSASPSGRQVGAGSIGWMNW